MLGSVSVCYGRARVGDRVGKNNFSHEYILNDIITARIFIGTDKTEENKTRNYLKTQGGEMYVKLCWHVIFFRFHIEKSLIKDAAALTY